MRTTFFVFFLLTAVFGASVLWSEVVSSFTLELAFFDIGQGDAIFFETPQGHQALIDGGPDAVVLSRLGEVMPFWDKTLDLLVLTHPDADHITGFIPVLERYEVKNILWTGKTKDTKAFAAFSAAMEQEGARVILAKAGQDVVFEGSDAFLRILYPKEGADLEKAASNETSIIALLQYRDVAVLLPGDTTQRIEKQLVREGIELKADILKVAHHGSSTSSSLEFLKAVDPHHAVISVGSDNRFGHPRSEVLANFAEYGITVRRTDAEGTIYFHFK